LQFATGIKGGPFVPVAVSTRDKRSFFLVFFSRLFFGNGFYFIFSLHFRMKNKTFTDFVHAKIYLINE